MKFQRDFVKLFLIWTGSLDTTYLCIENVQGEMK